MIYSIDERNIDESYIPIIFLQWEDILEKVDFTGIEKAKEFLKKMLKID